MYEVEVITWEHERPRTISIERDIVTENLARTIGQEQINTDHPRKAMIYKWDDGGWNRKFVAAIGNGGQA